MGAKLDKSRDFGEVSGDLEDGTRYFQDDKRFDGHGNEIAEVRTVEANTKKARPAASAPIATTVDADVADPAGELFGAAPVGADDQLASQLAGA